MPVEDVNRPKTVKTVDPHTTGEKDEKGDEYWARKARESKNRLDYQESENAMRQMGQTPESPFQVRGSVNLGEFDLQEQQRLARDNAEKVRKDTDTQLKEERGKREKAEEELYQERVEGLRRDFDTRIGELTKTIEKLTTAPKKDERSLHERFREEFQAVQELAKDLGLERTATGQDPMIQLELAKLSYQQAREEREFKRQMRNDEKQFQMQLQQMRDQQDYQKAQLEQQSRRDDIITNITQQFGVAVGRGIRDGANGVSPPEQQVSQQPRNRKAYEVKVQPGQQGALICPECKAEVGIGPDSESAQCVTCRTHFAIVRDVGEASEPISSGIPTQNEEDEE